MIPLLPYALGLATGVVAVRVIRSAKTRKALERAQTRLSSATVSGLEAVERASAKARTQLAAPQPPAAPAEEPPAPKATHRSAAKAPARRSASRKTPDKAAQA